MLSSMRAVVLLPEAASSLAVTTSVAPPKEGAAPLATAALLAAGCSGAFKSLTASYSSRICRMIGHCACRQSHSTDQGKHVWMLPYVTADCCLTYLAPQLGFLTANRHKSQHTISTHWQTATRKLSDIWTCCVADLPESRSGFDP